MCEFNASLGGGAAVDERNTHRARARSTRTARNMVRQCDLRGEKQTRHGERGGATRSTAHGCVSDGGCASLYRSSDHKARNMVRTTTSGAREANPVRKPRRKFVLLESPRKQPYEPLTNAPWQQVHSTARGYVAQRSQSWHGHSRVRSVWAFVLGACVGGSGEPHLNATRQIKKISGTPWGTGVTRRRCRVEVPGMRGKGEEGTAGKQEKCPRWVKTARSQNIPPTHGGIAFTLSLT
jgi:hypothetical protein